MNLNCRLAALAALIAITSGAVGTRAAEPQPVLWHSNLSAAWKTTLDTHRPLILFVKSDGCHYCHKMLRTTYNDRDVLDDIQRGFVAVKVDAAAHPALVKELKVRAYPTTFIISSDAVVLDAITGYAEPAKLRAHLSNAYRVETARRNQQGTKGVSYQAG